MYFPGCNFPTSVCQHHGEFGWQRREFAGCGSFSQVDCYFQEDTNSTKLKCSPQKGFGTIDGLSDNLPPLPLYSQSFSECVSIKDHILGVDNYQDAIQSSKFVVDHLPYTIIHRKANFFEKLEKARHFVKKCQDGSANSKKDLWKQLNDTVPPDVIELAVRYSDPAKAFNDNCMLGFNRDFYQGLLCHKQSSKSTLLFHAAGNQFKDIYVTEVAEKKNGLPFSSQMSKVSLDEPVFQLNCSEEGLICARQEKQCTVLTYNESNQCLNKLTQTDSLKAKLSDVELSPYNNELLLSSTTGKICLWSLDSGSKISIQKAPVADCPLPWTSSYFAGHPRQIVITDPLSMTIFDHRDKFKKGVDIFHLGQNKDVSDYERVMAATLMSFPYHLVTTDHSLLVLDQRFPGSPVLKWTTLGANTPQYLKSCRLANARDDGRGEHFVFLGSQQPAEVLCYPVQLPMGCAPLAKTLPWRVGKIGDFVRDQNTSYAPLWFQIDKFYQSSLAGMTVVNHPGQDNHVTSVYQLDGYGDIYFQDFKLAPKFEVPDCYSVVPPSEKEKTEADRRATAFLSSVDKTRVKGQRSKAVWSKTEEKEPFRYSDFNRILDKVSTSKRLKGELEQDGLSHIQFLNKSTSIKRLKNLQRTGSNTKLLLALKDKQYIQDLLIERENDYKKKKQDLRRAYLERKAMTKTGGKSMMGDHKRTKTE